MIPISDENPTLRTPVVTYALLATTVVTWLLVQRAGFDPMALAASVCNFGMVPGELTGRSTPGLSVPLGPNLSCIVNNEPLNVITPITSMFLHGGWGHLLGNMMFFWVFGNNIEDSMGRARFLAFYLICGLAAAAAHVFMEPRSLVPTVGASGAISGILGAYLVLYPRVRVKMLFILVIIIRVIPLPAWLVLAWWFFLQLVSGLPDLLSPVRPDVIKGGVAVWAHIGGFVAGAALVKFFENHDIVRRRTLVSDARGVWDSTR